MQASLLAIVVVPARVALLARHFDVATELTVADVAQVMVQAFLLPLDLGALCQSCQYNLPFSAVPPALRAEPLPCTEREAAGNATA